MPLRPGGLDTAKVLIAFRAGVRYHDALMAYSADAPQDRGSIVQDESLDEIFEAWHLAIAEALGTEP
jgi:hypothetical protein